MARFVRSTNVVARRIAGEIVLVPISTRTESAERRTANFYVLNETAELLWERLASPADVEDLTQQLSLHYEIDAAQANEDVANFLSALAGCGAIDTVELT